jgi:signal transduction histidine kinase
MNPGPKILIVDDNESSRLLLTDTMKAQGYDTDFARNGLEALEKVKEFRPDLILLDVMMPVMDGFEACRRLKSVEETRYITVVMLTARGEIEDKVVGLEIGAEDYIVKPFSVVEVTARVKSFLRMRALQSRLAESEKLAALGGMVDGIAHEVRNPLTTIGGMARRLFEHEKDPERRRYVEMIMKSVERMEKMMARIDDYKRILAGRFERGDINEVIKKAVGEVSPLVGDKRISFRTELMPDPPRFPMDSGNLKIAVFNVLLNSVEAMEKEGEIRIQTLPSMENSIILKISDNGPGMDEEFVREIFHPFHTSKITGAGLGLAITHRIVTDHRGTIEVESKPSKGTTVTMRFLLSPGAPAI